MKTASTITIPRIVEDSWLQGIECDTNDAAVARGVFCRTARTKGWAGEINFTVEGSFYDEIASDAAAAEALLFGLSGVEKFAASLNAHKNMLADEAQTAAEIAAEGAQ